MSTYPVDDLIGYLTGRWLLERSIEDRTSGADGGFEGELVCSADHENELTMYEHGELSWAGVTRPAYRTTRLLAGDRGSTGRVVFEDGRLFHDLDLSGGACEATHPCAADVYRGSFVVHGPDSWAYEWLVSGPHKDLRLTSRLIRVRPHSR